MKLRISFEYQYPTIISVSANLSEMWVHLKLAIHRYNATIHKAVISELSAVFNLAVVGCIGVLKLLLMCWYIEHLRSDIAAPESIRAL